MLSRMRAPLPLPQGKSCHSYVTAIQQPLTENNRDGLRVSRDSGVVAGEQTPEMDKENEPPQLALPV